MYRVDRNNFYKVQKKATIFTPDYVSDFLFDLISPHIKKDGLIIDPCVGQGSLLKPFKKNGYKVLGIDIENQGFPKTMVRNYLEIKKGEIKGKVSLVIMNPPFNIDGKTKQYIKENYGGRPLLPEVWFSKTVELFGHETPIVMFTPYGFRLNQSDTSKRWLKFINNEYPEITTIVSLPKDVFENILFHSEILMFNMPKLKGHYFVKDNSYGNPDKVRKGDYQKPEGGFTRGWLNHPVDNLDKPLGVAGSGSKERRLRVRKAYS